jgi:hypothetical protein
MATLRASAPSARRVPVTLAVALSALLLAANLVAFALPTGGESVPAFVIASTIVLSAAGIPAAIGLWLLRRWGYLLTLVVMALNALTAIPGVPVGPTAAIKVFSALFALASVAIIVLVTRPEARRAYR